MSKELWEIYCSLADMKKKIDDLQIKICKLCPIGKFVDEGKTPSTISTEDYD